MSPSGPEPADVPTIPTEKELATLPRWACVAFAARCARRVQTLYKLFWPEAPVEHVETLDKVITLVQASAAGPSSTSDSAFDANVTAAAAAVYAANVTAAAAAAANAAYAAAEAAEAANAAANVTAAVYPYAYAAAAAAAAAANAAARAAYAAYAAANAYAAAAMRRDYELLKAAAKAEQWTNDTPVPPAFFGPLWPFGKPEHWSSEADTASAASETPALKIEISVPAGMNKAESDAFDLKVKELLAELSRLDVLMGGNGLKILGASSSEPLPVEDEQPRPEFASGEGVCVGGAR